jgi:hypothetical protein
MQGRKPITFYFQELNSAQKRYTNSEREQELLSAIETCKEYKNVLLGYHQPIIVSTNHKNTFNGLKASDRVLRWLVVFYKDGLSFEYLPGKKNVVADGLSHHDIDRLKNQLKT